MKGRCPVLIRVYVAVGFEIVSFCSSSPQELEALILMDYSKLKVTELKELLTARSLPVSGKKEELVARLTEADSTNPTTADDLGDLAPPEEEYDWDTPAAGTYALDTMELTLDLPKQRRNLLLQQPQSQPPQKSRNPLPPPLLRKTKPLQLLQNNLSKLPNHPLRPPQNLLPLQ
jgi:hypothetical protein